MKALAMMAWISLLGGDPLVDPWEDAFSEHGAIEAATFHGAWDPEDWRLDDNELLDPFEHH